MTLRPGFGASALSVVLVAVTAIFMATTATELQALISGLMVAAVISHTALIFIGSPRLVIGSSAFVLIAVTVEALVSDDPFWVRSLVVGLLWYVAMEVSWHALDSRDGTTFTRKALAHRAQEVAGVVALTLVLGVVAIILATGAPARSVALQSVVLAGVLAGLAYVAGQLTSDDDSSASIT